MVTPISNLIHSKNKISYLTYLFFFTFFKEDCSIKDKFAFYKNTNNNIFLNDDQKKEINTLFFKIQFAYFVLTNFVNSIKIKKATLIVDADLCSNTLDIHDKNTLCIYQNNGKYLFSIIDMRKIITNALTNSSRFFFSEPLPIKNPYNNLPFTKSNLYNIYFHITFNTHYNIDLFHKFFLVNFDLTVFFDTYEYVLRENAIHNFVYRSSITLLHNDIKQMINYYNLHNVNKIHINSDFPKEKLVHIMRPYLMLDLTSLYSLIKPKKQNAFLLLNKKLNDFYKFNPMFGRKIITRTSYYEDAQLQKKLTITFNDKHIRFNKCTNNTFLTNHIRFDYTSTIEHILSLISDRAINIVVYEEEEEVEEEEEGDEVSF